MINNKIAYIFAIFTRLAFYRNIRSMIINIYHTVKNWMLNKRKSFPTSRLHLSVTQALKILTFLSSHMCLPLLSSDSSYKRYNDVDKLAIKAPTRKVSESCQSVERVAILSGCICNMSMSMSMSQHLVNHERSLLIFVIPMQSHMQPNRFWH